MGLKQRTSRILTVVLTLPFAVLAACGKNDVASQVNCAPLDVGAQIAGSTGTGLVFKQDPITASGKKDLDPDSDSLNEYRSEVTLERLSGKGVLEGRHLEVRNELQCDLGFGAYQPDHRFAYEHGDARFQETMTYHYGDQFRAKLEAIDRLAPLEPLVVLAPCSEMDNAFFARIPDERGQFLQLACFGRSSNSDRSTYSDDAAVVVHELQHGTTVNTYSMEQELNQLLYDEAGGLNEAISDFVALAFFAPSTPSSIDPRVFGRWALSKLASSAAVRGAHRCPMYDSSFPECGSFRSEGVQGFSTERETISYVYPDGLGWPYANALPGAPSIERIYQEFSLQEEIHNTAPLMTGALWEMFESLRANRGGDADAAQTLAFQIVMDAIALLPKPTIADRTPVNYRVFAAELVEAARMLGVSGQDLQGIESALRSRGLIGGPAIASWAEIGGGARVLDQPDTLREMLQEIGIEGPGMPTAITQSGPNAGNNRLDRGEVVAIWFDVLNRSEHTVGAVTLTVSASDPDIRFLGPRYNFGFLSRSSAQIQYAKINGTGIVQALPGAAATNSYFGTNPEFDSHGFTAIWIQANPDQATRKTVTLRVELTPSNGDSQVLEFPVTIN